MCVNIEIVDDIVTVGFYHEEEVVERGLLEFPNVFNPQRQLLVHEVLVAVGVWRRPFAELYVLDVGICEVRVVEEKQFATVVQAIDPVLR